jgi:hypothetical protein
MSDDDVTKLATEERFAQAVDRVAAMVAATAAFVVCLPGAGQVD